MSSTKLPLVSRHGHGSAPLRGNRSLVRVSTILLALVLMSQFAEWVELVEKKPGNNLYRCNLCKEQLRASGDTRVAAHLAGVAGQGVAPCKAASSKAPQAVKAAKAFLAEQAASKEAKRKAASELEDARRAAQRKTSHETAGTSGAAAARVRETRIASLPCSGRCECCL
jgi:hypothetical protein